MYTDPVEQAANYRDSEEWRLDEKAVHKHITELTPEEVKDALDSIEGSLNRIKKEACLSLHHFGELRNAMERLYELRGDADAFEKEYPGDSFFTNCSFVRSYGDDNN